jgi:EpsI family protein
MLGALFAGSAGVVFARTPRTSVDYLGPRKLDDVIPKSIGRWQFETTSGLIVPPEDALSDALYSQLLTRVYADGAGPPVMLLVAQSSGQTGILQIHRPEVCYPAGGFALSDVTSMPIRTPAGPFWANQLMATRRGRQEQILYWTRVGDAMPTNWAEQRWAAARDNLEGTIPDAVLVRVSTVDPDRRIADARLATFIEAMVGGMSPADRRVLIA